MKVYMVGFNKQEAQELYDWALENNPDIIHLTQADAQKHIDEIKKPPTDSWYGNQYKIYPLSVKLKCEKE